MILDMVQGFWAMETINILKNFESRKEFGVGCQEI
jgi:hypothetical protein